jgi:hypothetical protein
MDLTSKWSDRARSGASSARCLSGLHFRVWRRGVSMMAVTVVCDEKSMVDKAREWGHSLLPHKAGRTMSAVPRPPSALAQGRLSRKAREGAHPQLVGRMLKRQTRVLLPRESGPPAPKLRNNLDHSHNVFVQLLQIRRRNPVFAMLRAANGVHLVMT